MSRRIRPLFVPVLAVAVLATSGCFALPSPQREEASTTGSIEIQPLFVQGESGGVGSEGALGNAIDLGRDQLGGEIRTLADNETAPVLTVGSYEAAGLMNDGDPNNQFAALSECSYGFVRRDCSPISAASRTPPRSPPTERRPSRPRNGGVIRGR